MLVPVDALPAGASPYGVLHMSGNVLEWVSDWYRQNLCDFCNPESEANLPLVRTIAGREQPAAEEAGKEKLEGAAAGGEAARQRQAPPRENPAGPSTGSFKVLRGGSWHETMDVELATTRRFWLDPAQRFANTGFRCVKDESPASATEPDAGPARGSLDMQTAAGVHSPP